MGPWHPCQCQNFFFWWFCFMFLCCVKLTFNTFDSGPPIPQWLWHRSHFKVILFGNHVPSHCGQTFPQPSCSCCSPSTRYWRWSGFSLRFMAGPLKTYTEYKITCRTEYKLSRMPNYGRSTVVLPKTKITTARLFPSRWSSTTTSEVQA